MTVVIWGAGAIGGVIGAHLARSGREVLFVDRIAEHVAAIAQDGITIAGPVAEFTVNARAALPEDVAGPLKTVLLCTKGQDTEAAMRAIAPRLAEDGFVASIQNGLNELIVAEHVGRDHTVGGFVNFAAAYEQSGVIRFLDARRYGPHGSVAVGELDGTLTPRTRTLHQALRLFDPTAALTDNVLGYVWSKTAYAALLFATALVDAPLIEVFASPRHRALHVALTREVVRLAEADGVRPHAFNDFDPAPFRAGATDTSALAVIDDAIAKNRDSPKTHSGFWRDLKVLKRKTEIDGLFAPVVRVARERGVSAPLTERMIALVHEIEQGERDQSWGTLDALLEAVPA